LNRAVILAQHCVSFFRCNFLQSVEVLQYEGCSQLLKDNKGKAAYRTVAAQSLLRRLSSICSAQSK